MRKLSSYQELRRQVDHYVDSDMENLVFLSNVEARLTKVRARLQKPVSPSKFYGERKRVRREITMLLVEIAAKLTPSDEEIPF